MSPFTNSQILASGLTDDVNVNARFPDNDRTKECVDAAKRYDPRALLLSPTSCIVCLPFGSLYSKQTRRK